MSSSRKKQIIQAARKRQRRGRIYLIAAVIIIVVIGVGLYVYASMSGQSSVTYAKLNTSQGLIEIELYRNSAPQTVTNFVNLVNAGFYNRLVWHRIVPNFVIQTGDPNTRSGGGNRSIWGSGSYGQVLPFEYDSSLHNYAGYVGMASTAAGAGGTCQFYINLGDNSAALDGKYAVFGKVINGMNAVNSLASLPTTTQYSNSQAPQPANPTDAMIINATISSNP